MKTLNDQPALIVLMPPTWSMFGTINHSMNNPRLIEWDVYSDVLIYEYNDYNYPTKITNALGVANFTYILCGAQ